MKLKMIFPVVLVALSFSAFPQAKIGTNPTTISTDANLEVEATNNKKVLVRKSDGSFVIENTPSGASTDSILTIDNSGNVRRRPQSTPYLKLAGTMTVIHFSSTGFFIPVHSLAQIFRNDITYNSQRGEMTVTKPGIYFCSVFSLSEDLPDGVRNENCIGVYVNDVLVEPVACARNPQTTGTSATNAALHSLNAGDIVSVKFSYGTGDTTDETLQIQFAISLYMVSEL